MFMHKEGLTTEKAESSNSKIEVEKTSKPPSEPIVQGETKDKGETSKEQPKISEPQPDLSQYSLARDRQRRVIVPPARYADINYINLVLSVTVDSNDHEPTTFKEAISGQDAIQWIEAMNEEIHSLSINETWTLATLPKGYKPIPQSGSTN